MSVATYTSSGTKATKAAQLDKAVFAVEVKHHGLIQAAYVAYLANGRNNLAVTKTRGQVSGGGRKPWRQKGTGRARFGSSRNPIWRSGGIAFGPTGEENYSHNLPVSQKRQALRQALSLAAQENRIKIIESFSCKDGKVAQTAKLLKKLEASGNVLLVVSQKDQLVERATKNLAEVKAVDARYLSVFDVVNANTIVIDQKGLDVVHAWLGGTKA